MVAWERQREGALTLLREAVAAVLPAAALHRVQRALGGARRQALDVGLGRGVGVASAHAAHHAALLRRAPFHQLATLDQRRRWRADDVGLRWAAVAAAHPSRLAACP